MSSPLLIDRQVCIISLSGIAPPRKVPGPDIQADLNPRLNRQTSMIDSLMARAVRIEVLPENSGTCSRLERHALEAIHTILSAFNDIAPLCSVRSRQVREISPATFAVCHKVDHESGDAVSRGTFWFPVIVIVEKSSHLVSLQSGTLYYGSISTPALEVLGSLLDTEDHRVVMA